MKIKKTVFFLFLIIILAFFLRFYKLGSLLPLFGDEVDTSYNAFSILKTRKDITGHFLPVYLKTLIDTKSCLLAYLSAIPIIFLGLGEFSVRFIPAVCGVLIVLLVYLLVFELSQDNLCGLLASFLVASSPWAIHFSRGVFEANLMLCLILFGLWLTFHSFKKNIYLFFASIVFSLSLYAYHSAKILIPLLFIGIFLIFKKEISKINLKVKLVSLGVFVLVSLPAIYFSLFSIGLERYKGVSLVNNQKLIDKIIIKRQTDSSSLTGRFFHNKIETYISSFLSNYFESFSPQFLFLSGDPNFRNSVGNVGEFFVILLPFFLGGLYIFFKKKEKYSNLLIYWLLISPLPSAITVGGGSHAIRLIFMMPAVAIFIAFGITIFSKSILKKFGKKLFLVTNGALLITYLLYFFSFIHQYFHHYPKESWRYWAYGYKEAMIAVKEKESLYSRVFINNSYEPSILWFLFWNSYSPEKIHPLVKNNNFEEDNSFAGISGFWIGKYYFYKPKDLEWKYWGIQELFKKNKNLLVLASAKDDTAGDKDLRVYPLKGVKVLKAITNPENQPIFYILANE